LGGVEFVTESNDLPRALTGGEKLPEDLVVSAPQLTLEGTSGDRRRIDGRYSNQRRLLSKAGADRYDRGSP
jgi:hypothetical protein